jgi:hypothetical protein
LTLSGFATDKLLNNFQLVFSAGFKSAGVVKNITGVVSENEFVVDVMHATLRARSSGSAVTIRISLADLDGRVELNLAR